MQCRSCGATIAEKAIICYRCGTATALPEVVRPARRPAARVGGGVVAAWCVAVGLALLAWALPPGNGRIGSEAGAAAAAAVGVVLWFRSRRLAVRPGPPGRVD